MTLRFNGAILFLIFLMCPSCKNDVEEITRDVKLSPFHGLEMNGTFRVYLIQDTVYSIKIVGTNPELVSLTIANDVLSISNQAKGKWLNPKANKVELYIRSNQLNQILANETCYFETINPIISDIAIIMGSSVKLIEARLELDCNSFYYWNNYQCGGKITLSGRVNNLNVNMFAIMSVDASSLIANTATIDNDSKGECDLFVTDRLEYSIRGTGNIYLKGDPKEIVLDEKTSTGQLIHL